MTDEFRAYVPGRRSYGSLTGSLRAAWEAIVPSVDLYQTEYRPCGVTLKDGRSLPRVYVMDAQTYINVWGRWPEDQEGKHPVLIEDVVSLWESPFRLPARLATKLYRAGESGMGYCVFTLVFSDGTRQAYLTGNAVDFVDLPDGKTSEDIKKVLPHEGRRASPPKRGVFLVPVRRGGKPRCLVPVAPVNVRSIREHGTQRLE